MQLCNSEALLHLRGKTKILYLWVLTNHRSTPQWHQQHIYMCYLRQSISCCSIEILMSVLLTLTQAASITIVGYFDPPACKADELLQAANAFIKNDSPQRFGQERGLGSGVAKEDEDRFSQKWASPHHACALQLRAAGWTHAMCQQQSPKSFRCRSILTLHSKIILQSP